MLSRQCLLVAAAVSSLAVPAFAGAVDTRSVGELSKIELAEYLASIDDPDVNAVLREATGPTATRRAKKAYEYTGSVIGHMKSGGSGPWKITPAAQVHAEDLDRIDIRLDRLVVKRYPGRGKHDILVQFSATHRLFPNQNFTKSMEFAQTFPEVRDEVPVAGWPMLIGLRPPPGGVKLEGGTTNVQSSGGKKWLDILKGNELKGGLELLGSTVQPVLAPFTSLVKGIVERIVESNKDRTVQRFSLGLDKESSGPAGVRLATGYYIVAQANTKVLSWQDWHWKDGAIVAKLGDQEFPFNYLVFRISKHSGS
jgi:hypothetical protein